MWAAFKKTETGLEKLYLKDEAGLHTACYFHTLEHLGLALIHNHYLINSSIIFKKVTGPITKREVTEEDTFDGREFSIRMPAERRKIKETYEANIEKSLAKQRQGRVWLQDPYITVGARTKSSSASTGVPPKVGAPRPQDDVKYAAGQMTREKIGIEQSKMRDQSTLFRAKNHKDALNYINNRRKK